MGPQGRGKQRVIQENSETDRGAVERALPLTGHCLHTSSFFFMHSMRTMNRCCACVRVYVKVFWMVTSSWSRKDSLISLQLKPVPEQVSPAPIQYILLRDIIERRKALWQFPLERSFLFRYASHNSYFEWDNEKKTHSAFKSKSILMSQNLKEQSIGRFSSCLIPSSSSVVIKKCFQLIISILVKFYCIAYLNI